MNEVLFSIVVPRTFDIGLLMGLLIGFLFGFFLGIVMCIYENKS